jgi:hypothetical protein
MQDRCGLAFDYGSWFGGESSGSFIRINLATSRTNIEEMANRIIQQLTEFRFKEAGGGLQDDMDEMFRFEKKMV